MAVEANGIKYLTATEVQDLVDVTDADNLLTIDGNAGDSVTSTGEGWVQGNDQVIDNVIYHSYSSGTATLLIEDDVTQTIS